MGRVERCLMRRGVRATKLCFALAAARLVPKNSLTGLVSSSVAWNTLEASREIPEGSIEVFLSFFFF